jgi:FtsP/CotA-like multicopper oxidase with cupredoxin domain
MEMSSAAYSSLDPTDLGNFKNPLRLTGEKGLFALLDVSAGRSTQLTAREEAGILVYRAEQVAELAVDEAGRTITDLGWKDTVLVWPGETVRVAMNFSHGFEDDQVYLLHCHILEHEDAGMMINYRVVP